MFILQLRRDFRAVVDKENLKPLTTEWPEWVSKILKFARLEAISRPMIHHLLMDFDNPPKLDNTEGMCIRV